MTTCNHVTPSFLPGRPLLFGAARQCATLYSAAGDGKPQPKFKVLSRDLAYSGWRKIVKKTVQFEDEKEHVFDVVHQVPYHQTLLNKCLAPVSLARVSRCCADGVRSDCSSFVLSASLLRRPMFVVIPCATPVVNCFRGNVGANKIVSVHSTYPCLLLLERGILA